MGTSVQRSGHSFLSQRSTRDVWCQRVVWELRLLVSKSVAAEGSWCASHPPVSSATRGRRPRGAVCRLWLGKVRPLREEAAHAKGVMAAQRGRYHQNFVGESAVQVVIVPVGSIDEAKFREYAQVIAANDVIDIMELANPQLRWASGKVRIQFELYRAPLSEWHQFQLHNKVIGLIGVMHCPRLQSLKDTYQKCFENTYCKGMYPTVMNRKCLAFEPLPTQADIAVGDFVMIPNSDTREHLSFYVQAQISDFALTLLSLFEERVTKGIPLVTPLVTPLDANKTTEDTRLLKKREPARLLKMKGDYCLLGGQPQEAMAAYVAAIEPCKATNDWEWVGGAMEGYSAAVVAQNDDNVALHEDDVMSNAALAREYYQKRGTAHYLEIELLLKMARHQVDLGHKENAAELLMDAYNIGETHIDSDKIYLTGSIASLYREMQFYRKYAFFMWMTSVLYRKLTNYNASHFLLRHCLPHYYLSPLAPPSLCGPAGGDVTDDTTCIRQHKPLSEEAPKTEAASENGTKKSLEQTKVRTVIQREGSKGWVALQHIVLSDLALAAKSLTNNENTVKYISYLLRTLYPYIGSAEQVRLGADLERVAMRVNPPLNLCGTIIGLPVFTRLTPVGISTQAMPFTLPKNSGPVAGSFLYSAIAVRRVATEPKFTWVAGEKCEVKLEFTNPLSIDIYIDSVYVCTSGVPAEFYSQRMMIPKETASYEASLFGKALEPGIVTVTGVIIQSCGIIYFHPVKPNGAAVPLEEFYCPPAQPYKTLNNSNTVTVLASIPTVVVHGCLAHEKNTTAPPRYNLMEGERYVHRVELENVSTVRVGRITIELSDNGHPAKDSGPCAVLEGWPLTPEREAELLPLTSCHRLPFQINVLASTALTQVTLTIKYWESDTSTHGRSVTIPLHFQVMRGLKLLEFDATAVSESQCLITAAVFNGTPKAAQIRCSLEVEGGCAVPDCNAGVVIADEVVAEHNTTANVQFLAQRLEIPSELYCCDRAQLPAMTATIATGAKFVDWCRSFLSSHLRVHWTAAGNASGVLPVPANLAVSPRAALALVRPPLSLSFSVEGATSPMTHAIVPVRAPVAMTLRVTNGRGQLPSTPPPLVLQALPASGDPRLDSLVWLAGPCATNVQELAEGRSATHAFTACFLECGRFTFVGACRNAATKEYCSAVPLVVDVVASS
eukprot:TRINITY_DN1754_c0_g2_i4.p1 TRINITY_DN1754_c0_g2~~TRINITY_DN1754_c0_g2_i4.p1  ORF type:complete len:1178 (-),score=217.39 TRINITY_DN1754_c0_g2_i4:85-3618(-)